jgi:hypothetical protein
MKYSSVVENSEGSEREVTSSSLRAVGSTGTVTFDGTWISIDRSSKASDTGRIGRIPGVQDLQRARLKLPDGNVRIPISNVTGIDFRSAKGTTVMMHGHLGFIFAGAKPGAPGQHGMTGLTRSMSANDYSSDPNYVTFTPNQEPDFERLANEVQSALSMPVVTTMEPKNSASPLGVADELKKLADLKSSGLLTDQEFETQKRRLLDS